MLFVSDVFTRWRRQGEIGYLKSQRKYEKAKKKGIESKSLPRLRPRMQLLYSPRPHQKKLAYIVIYIVYIISIL